ncbi:hypothetical protein IJI18_02005 [Candidatus Saccharibacteria bacterium]|nr:hypothetical protein [Candidatus Saccharibacteria bacterium]
MKKIHKSVKRGAASFYIVAFSTLILVVIATGFATVILSEISRTANDDLSQSAYDSALAGVEDAKVAYANYRRCKEAGYNGGSLSAGSNVTCNDIVYWVETKPDCYMVGHILGKIGKNEQAEVTIGGVQRTGTKETTTNQAYTCVIINTDLKDYRATLNNDKKVQTLRASMGNGSTNAATKIRISWYSVGKTKDNTIGNYTPITDSKVTFPRSSSSVAVPPIVQLKIVQTGTEFRMEDFDKVENGRTNRATLFLVPTNNSAMAQQKNAENYIGVWNGSSNVVSAADLVKTNDHSIKNKAFVLYCNNSNEFYCNAEITLPGVIGGGARNNNTFMISVSLPYQKPNTDFAIALCENDVCDSPEPLNAVQYTVSGDTAVAKISNAQVAIDSTGRANDLYRRVETRLESADTTFGSGYPYYALEVLGDDGVKKTITTTYEGAFYF